MYIRGASAIYTHGYFLLYGLCTSVDLNCRSVFVHKKVEWWGENNKNKVPRGCSIEGQVFME